jgi:hypothetical protein
MTRKALPPELETALLKFNAETTSMLGFKEEWELTEYNRFADFMRPLLEKAFEGAFDNMPPDLFEEKKK